MKFMKFAVLAAAVIVLPGASVARAQDASAARPSASQVTLQELVLKDGSRLYGTVESESSTEVVFRTEAGTLVTAQRAGIASLRRVIGTMVRGEFQRADPNGTRLIFGPTGRALEKGGVYLGVYELMMPFLQVGVTDHFSIGAGTPLVFTFEDGWERPFWITPKLQVFEGSSSSISVGALHAFGPGGESGGIAYGVGTFGSEKGSVTIGAGAAYTGSGPEGAVLMVGAERRLHRSVKWVTENYLWTGGNGVASGGFRFLGERLSADVALAVPIGAEEFFVFPVVNFVYTFRGTR